jgi:hypothetical protein
MTRAVRPDCIARGWACASDPPRFALLPFTWGPRHAPSLCLRHPEQEPIASAIGLILPQRAQVHMTAEEIIAALDMKPHPEGGHFCETYRAPPGADGRAMSTAIYFLLRAGECSRWHKLDAPEIWHFYAGAPLELIVLPPHPSPLPGGEREDVVHAPRVPSPQRGEGQGEGGMREEYAAPVTYILGTDFLRGERPQALVPAHAWQSAKSLGAYTLVGCTMAPGFAFSGFTLAPDGFAPARSAR